MRRFFVSPTELKQDHVSLKDEEFHHLKNVSRFKEGETVELLDGQGTLAVAIIEKIEKKSASLKVKERKTLPPIKKPLIEIVLCIPRFQIMDVIIQKSVELGVSKITPVLSDRSFFKKPSSDLKDKMARWNKIGLEACKQSGRVWPMEIAEPQTLESYIKKPSEGASLFLYEGQETLNIKQALEKLTSLPQIRVYIGAEGGFSPQEVQLFLKNGLQPVTLGELVLRVETACITAVSVIKYHFDLMV